MSSVNSTSASLLSGAATNLAAVRAFGTTADQASATTAPGTGTSAMQAQQGAATVGQAVQPQAPTAATQVPEPFNAPMLKLPKNATMSDTLSALSTVIADPTVNKSSAEQLYQFQQQLLDYQKQMISAFVR